jgi:hypothetical protein
MPVIDGWQLSRMIRKNIGRDIPIIMVSANNRNERIIASGIKDENYLMKPIVVPVLLNKIAAALHLKWILLKSSTKGIAKNEIKQTKLQQENLPPHTDREDLKKMGEIGHVLAIRDKLNLLKDHNQQYEPFVNLLMPSIRRFEIKTFMTLLSEIENETY